MFIFEFRGPRQVLPSIFKILYFKLAYVLRFLWIDFSYYVYFLPTIMCVYVFMCVYYVCCVIDLSQCNQDRLIEPYNFDYILTNIWLMFWLYTHRPSSADKLTVAAYVIEICRIFVIAFNGLIKGFISIWTVICKVFWWYCLVGWLSKQPTEAIGHFRGISTREKEKENLCVMERQCMLQHISANFRAEKPRQIKLYHCRLVLLKLII